YMLSILDGQPSSYKEFAESYYEKSGNLDAIERIYGHEPLTAETVYLLNDEITLESFTTDPAQIDYARSNGTEDVSSTARPKIASPMRQINVEGYSTAEILDLPDE